MDAKLEKSIAKINELDIETKELVKKISLYNERINALKKAEAYRTKEVDKLEKELSGLRSQIASGKEQLASVTQVFEAKFNVERQKLQTFEQTLKQQQIQLEHDDIQLKNALSALDAQKEERRVQLVAIALQERILKEREAKAADILVLTNDLETKTQAFKKRAEQIDTKAVHLQSKIVDVLEQEKQLKKQIAVSHGQERTLGFKTAEAQEIINKYIAVNELLQKREGLLYKQECELALEKKRVEKKQQDIKSLTQSLDNRKFEYEVWEARINKVIQKKNLQDELKKG